MRFLLSCHFLRKEQVGFSPVPQCVFCVFSVIIVLCCSCVPIRVGLFSDIFCSFLTTELCLINGSLTVINGAFSEDCFRIFFVIFARLLPSVVLMLSAAIECTIVKILSLCRKPPDSGLSADIEPTLAWLQNVLLLRFLVFFLRRKTYPA